MTSSDVRDVLNLPDSGSGPRPSKKQKVAAPKPSLKGLAREVHNLGGDNPIAIVPEVTQFKKRRFASRKPAARWELRPFRNSGREDQTLVLRHWRRQDAKQDGQAQPQADGASKPDEDELEDSAFAKYSVNISVPQYNDEQYRELLDKADWTREETDYLMEVVQDFDLRWPLIWDRYEWNPPATNGEANADGDESKAVVPAARPRSMEDLKARYYEVASKVMAAQKPVQHMTPSEYSLYDVMANFNAQQEKARKDFALNSLSRSREEAREEESLLLEIKRILARSDRFNEERRELYNRLDYPRAETDISPFKSSAGLQTLLQNLMSVDKSKKRKSLMGADGMSPGGAAGPQGGGAPESGKRDSNAGTHRDSTGAVVTPSGASKKAQQPQQQPQERRKLSGQEEAIYGVTYHERLSSGPTFRTEKINKLFSHKSNQQQMRINNALNELDVPSKLAMATAATTQQYEQLLASVNSLLEARKLSDKLDGEIKLEQAKKADREKAPAPADAEPQPAPQKGEVNGAGAGAGASGDAARREGRVEQRAVPAAEGGGGTDASHKPGPAEAQGDGVPRAEDNVRREKSARPGNESCHKRSASVMSAVSDKSAKRHKK